MMVVILFSMARSISDKDASLTSFIGPILEKGKLETTLNILRCVISSLCLLFGDEFFNLINILCERHE